jgi:pyridoxal/pyridoxine/pyridoxamine kinase
MRDRAVPAADILTPNQFELEWLAGRRVATLDDAKAAQAAWTPTTRKYTIGGRQMEFNSGAEILQLISHWQVEVKREQAAERIAAGLDARRKVHVRLGRA